MVCLGFEPGRQDGRRERIHWATAAPLLLEGLLSFLESDSIGNGKFILVHLIFCIIKLSYFCILQHSAHVSQVTFLVSNHGFSFNIDLQSLENWFFVGFHNIGTNFGMKSGFEGLLHRSPVWWWQLVAVPSLQIIRLLAQSLVYPGYRSHLCFLFCSSCQLLLLLSL